jgi:FkbM family methyltransferase
MLLGVLGNCLSFRVPFQTRVRELPGPAACPYCRSFMASILPTLRFIATHPLSSRQPLSAFWRYGRWQIESRLRPEVEFKWIEGSKLIARNGMTGATGNIYCGLHEFVDMAFLLHLLRPDDLFVDVGANIGSYSVLASAVCGAHSVAVEPDPGTMESLKRNIGVNGVDSHVTLVEAALGAERGTVNFTVGRDTTNHVATDIDVSTREVQLRTLDEILDGKSPVLIKIDVEGYEAEVMKGASNTLLNTSLLAILIETVHQKVRSQLEAAGFKQAGYDPFARRLAKVIEHTTPLSNNYLFVRDLDTCRQRVKAAVSRDVLGQPI